MIKIWIIVLMVVRVLQHGWVLENGKHGGVPIHLVFRGRGSVLSKMVFRNGIRGEGIRGIESAIVVFWQGRATKPLMKTAIILPLSLPFHGIGVTDPENNKRERFRRTEGLKCRVKARLSA